MRKKLVLVVVLASCFSAIHAQLGGPAPEVKVKLSQASGVAGGQLKGELIVTFAQGLHGYQNPPSKDYMIPVTVRLGDKSKFKLAKITFPKGEPMNVPGETKPAQVYTGTIHIPFVLTLPQKAGKSAVAFHLGYQECNDQSCYPPGDVASGATVIVKKAAKSPKR